jgi:dipeptidyl-peptidase-3
MHEVIGHASGQINAGVGSPKETLKNYGSTIEEARADLVGLYYIMDQKLVDIGVIPNLEVGKAEYDRQMRNGLMTQLTRLKLGDDVEEAHMRNRQVIAAWVYEKGLPEKIVEKKKKDGRTYIVINDYAKLRALYGQLLKETQRITSEGDFKGAQKLIETYGVKVDHDLHKEVLERFGKLKIAPYAGLINPKLVPVMEGGKMVDVKIEFPLDFTEQMMDYAKTYSFLPTHN